MTPQPELDVIIVNWNSASYTLAAIRSFLTYVTPKKIILVDGKSKPEDLEVLKIGLNSNRFDVEIQLICAPENDGFGAANNLGFEKTDSEFVLLLNPDTLITSDPVSQIISDLKKDKRVGAAGCLLLSQDGSPQVSHYELPTLRTTTRAYFFHRGAALPLPSSVPLEVEAIVGCFMLLRRRTILDLPEGLFDPKFFMYSEEVDLCKRLHNAGHAIRFDPRVSIIHFGGGSSKEKQVRAQLYFELQKSKVRYIDKHFGKDRKLSRLVVKLGTIIDLAAQIKGLLLGKYGFSQTMERAKFYFSIWRL